MIYPDHRYRGKEGWAPRAYLKSASHLSLATTAPNADVVKDKGAIQEKGRVAIHIKYQVSLEFHSAMRWDRVC